MNIELSNACFDRIIFHDKMLDDHLLDEYLHLTGAFCLLWNVFEVVRKLRCGNKTFEQIVRVTARYYVLARPFKTVRKATKCCAHTCI